MRVLSWSLILIESTLISHASELSRWLFSLEHLLLIKRSMKWLLLLNVECKNFEIVEGIDLINVHFLCLQRVLVYALECHLIYYENLPLVLLSLVDILEYL